jgi:hypothetical protein
MKTIFLTILYEKSFKSKLPINIIGGIDWLQKQRLQTFFYSSEK